MYTLLTTISEFYYSAVIFRWKKEAEIFHLEQKIVSWSRDSWKSTVAPLTRELDWRGCHSINNYIMTNIVPTGCGRLSHGVFLYIWIATGMQKSYTKLKVVSRKSWSPKPDFCSTLGIMDCWTVWRRNDFGAINNFKATVKPLKGREWHRCILLYRASWHWRFLKGNSIIIVWSELGIVSSRLKGIAED